MIGGKQYSSSFSRKAIETSVTTAGRIGLLTAAYIIYARIITRRLNVISEALLNEVQHGFRKGRSCMDCVLAIKQIIKKRR
jgi:hypothetical protein